MFVNILLAANLQGTEQLSWDTIRLIIQSQSNLAQSQSNLAMYGITVLVAVAVLLAGASWVTNFYLVRRELRRAIESLRSEITASREENYGRLASLMRDEVEKMKKAVEESVQQKMKSFDADKARLFALSAQQGQVWESAAFWWAIAIKGYLEVKKDALVRISVDNVIENLERCERLEDDTKKEIERYISSIPRILEEEKKQIETKLNELSRRKKISGK